MRIESRSATITFNSDGNPTYCLTCFCDLMETSPSGLWWLVDTHLLPRMRLLHNFAADVAYYARRMVRTGFGGQSMAEMFAEIERGGKCQGNLDGSIVEGKA